MNAEAIAPAGRAYSKQVLRHERRRVDDRTAGRILDTLGAIVSGAKLKPGEMAIRYVRAQGGAAEASVPTTDIRTTAVNAALQRECSRTPTRPTISSL